MKKRMSIQIFTSLAMLLPLSGARAIDIDWIAGGRHGWVLDEYDESAAKESLPNCLKTLSKDDFSNKHYVKIHYKNIRKYVEVVAEVPTSMHLIKGDEVEVYPEKCSEGKLSHITKLLDHAHPLEQHSAAH